MTFKEHAIDIIKAHGLDGETALSGALKYFQTNQDLGVSMRQALEVALYQQCNKRARVLEILEAIGALVDGPATF